jgi:hypothetical protein
VRSEGELGLDGGRSRIARVLEDDEELVAAMIDDVPACLRDHVAHEAAVIVEELGVGVAETADELRRALDVGEDERE